MFPFLHAGRPGQRLRLLLLAIVLLRSSFTRVRGIPSPPHYATTTGLVGITNAWCVVRRVACVFLHPAGCLFRCRMPYPRYWNVGWWGRRRSGWWQLPGWMEVGGWLSTVIRACLPNPAGLLGHRPSLHIQRRAPLARTRPHAARRAGTMGSGMHAARAWRGGVACGAARWAAAASARR